MCQVALIDSPCNYRWDYGNRITNEPHSHYRGVTPSPNDVLLKIVRLATSTGTNLNMCFRCIMIADILTSPTPQNTKTNHDRQQKHHHSGVAVKSMSLWNWRWNRNLYVGVSVCVCVCVCEWMCLSGRVSASEGGSSWTYGVCVCVCVGWWVEEQIVTCRLRTLHTKEPMLTC